MRLIIYLRPLIPVFVIVVCFSSCIKEPRRIMEVKNDSISDITSTSAIIYSTIVDIGPGIEEHGHCWSKNADPTIDANEDKTEIGPRSSTGSYSSLMTGLTYNTKYYVRAYIKNSSTVVYSDDILSFQTLAIGIPSVTTGAVDNITTSSAVISGNLVDFGSGASSVSQYGHCWSSETTTPITDNNKTSLGPKNTTGSFESILVGLSQGTLYYVRAYATNDEGTAYGNHVSFTTAQEGAVPVVITASINSITQSSAVGGGNVTSDGGTNVSARGVCWNSTGNPTLSDNYTSDGDGTGSFTSNISGLSSGTTYYVRAYATNSAGTAYGNQVSFTAGQSITSPVVTTSTISSITYSSAVSGGNVTSDGGAAVTARGVCWNTTGSPDFSDSHTTDGSGTGSFTSNITDLSPSNTYYVRAYATNSAGTAYGEQLNFKTEWDNSSVTDYDGNIYSTVQIGEQIWMVENLKTTRYNDGSNIPLVTDNTAWSNLLTPAYCWYENSESTYKNPYGALYTWYAVNTGKLCPEGWRIPTDDEWTTLTTYLGGASVTGGKLKETGTSHWKTPNTGATNETGFTAVPGGHRYRYNGNFYDTKLIGYWWSSEEDSAHTAWSRYINYNSSDIYRDYFWKHDGFSVRCIKD